MITRKSACTCCLSESIHTFIDFGSVPLAGSFVSSASESRPFPLSLSYCDKCSHVQVNEYIDMEHLFLDYRYVSGYSMRSHFREFAQCINARFGFGLKTLEIGSNDGTFLSELEQFGYHSIGVEPAENISKIAIDRGLKVVQGFFSLETLEKAGIKENSFDVVSASNCFAHIEDIDAILHGVRFALSDYGTFVIEVHYGPNVFRSGQYDFVYHEHMYYYSLSSLTALLARHDLVAYDVEFIQTHGGSVRVFAQKQHFGPHKITNNLVEAMRKEVSDGYCSLSTYTDFQKNTRKHIEECWSTIDKIKSSEKSIVAFGASGRANAFLNYAKIGADIIDYIIDESPERTNRYIPQVMIPIRPLSENSNSQFDCLFITAWNFSEQILKKCEKMTFSEVLVAFPEIQLRSR
jgi:SAM-dependent methyltransferase